MSDETRAIVASNLTLAYFNANPEELVKKPTGPTTPGTQYSPLGPVQILVKHYSDILRELRQQEEIQKA